MTESDVKALVRGIAPVLRERFHEQETRSLAVIEALARRVAELEEQATRP